MARTGPRLSRLDRRRGSGALALAFLALATLSSLGSCSRKGAPLPSVVLVSVDTLRADRLSCYGYGRETSPHVDRRIAAGGVRFTDATSASNNTSCSFASIHTGTYVRTHGVVSLAPLGYEVAERFETLAESLRGMGYKTAAAVSAAHLNAKVSGLGQGFDLFVDHDGTEPKRRAAATNAALFPPLRERLRSGDAAAPLFLWVHYFDPHWPYDPEPADLAALPLPEGSSREPLPEIKPGLAGDAEESDALRDRAAEMSARYDALVRESDRGVGELLDFLERERVLPNAIVVFTADHGENLGEHGLYFNHARLYEPVIRVPLLIHAPGIEAAVRGDMVHTIDLFPTVLDLLNASNRAPDALEGESLAPLLRGRRPPARDAVFSESGNWRDKAVKTAAGEKVVLPPGLFGAEMYDLRADPGETREIGDERPARRDALAREITEFAGPATWRFRLVAPPGAPASARFEVVPETAGGGAASDADTAPIALEAAAGGHDEKSVSVRLGGLFIRGADPALVEAATLGFRPFLDHLVSVVVEPGAEGGAPITLARELAADGSETLVVTAEPGSGGTLKLRVGAAGRFGAIDAADGAELAATVVEDGHRLRATGAIRARARLRAAIAPPGGIVLADAVVGDRRVPPSAFSAGPPNRPPVLYLSPTLLSAEASPLDPRMAEILSRPGLHVWREPGAFRIFREAQDLDPGERKRLQGLGYLGGPNR